MPLIWNDDRTEVIDDSDDFDRSEFVIVRKVFLQFKEQSKNIDEQWIRDHFKQYGDIESVEVFVKDDGNIWAYLTFVDADEVHRAVRDAPKFDEIDVALPADTWSQPTSFSFTQPDNEEVVAALKNCETAIASGQSPTDDSLRQLISLSTKSNSESLKEALNDRILPTVKSFEFKLTDAKGVAMSLSEVRSILRYIGPHISQLAVTFRMDKYPKHVNRYFQKMCQYVGPHLHTLTLNCFPSNQDWLVELKPLLGRIERLVLRTSNYDFEYDIDFQLYCPNVKTLKIAMNLNGTFLSKRQPKLERISNLHNQFMEERLVLELMKNNPQLVYMKIEANDCNNLLKQIPLHLPKLEKLGLHQGYPNMTADNLEHLTAMKQLKRLKLMYLDEEDFNGILNCLPKFRQLEELKLHLLYDGSDSVDVDDIFTPNLDLIVTLAQELPELKCFHMRYCKIDAETLYSFIRSAKKLESLSIYRSGLEITDTILECMESIRKAVCQTTMVFNADRIHPELNREKTYTTVKLAPL